MGENERAEKGHLGPEVAQQGVDQEAMAPVYGVPYSQKDSLGGSCDPPGRGKVPAH